MVLAGPAKEGRQNNFVELEKYQKYQGCEGMIRVARAIPRQDLARGIKPSSSRLMAEKFAVAAELRG